MEAGKEKPTDDKGMKSNKLPPEQKGPQTITSFDTFTCILAREKIVSSLDSFQEGQSGNNFILF